MLAGLCRTAVLPIAYLHKYVANKKTFLSLLLQFGICSLRIENLKLCNDLAPAPSPTVPSRAGGGGAWAAAAGRAASPPRRRPGCAADPPLGACAPQSRAALATAGRAGGLAVLAGRFHLLPQEGMVAKSRSQGLRMDFNEM
jgi:hypothetical protein